jgi:hypothetical protein
MAYIGKEPAEAFSSFQKQDFTTSATTSYTLDHPVANQNEIALFINFVRQEPTTAYTASGTSLTLTSATASTDDMYCVYLGKAVQTVNPPNSSVGSSQVSADLITGQTALATAPADTDEFLISDAGTLKRIDYSLIKATTPVAGTLSFQAYRSGNLAVSATTQTELVFNAEVTDPSSKYDTSTGRYTPGVAGTYFVKVNVTFDPSGNQGASHSMYLKIRKSGSGTTEYGQISFKGTSGQDVGLSTGAVIELGATDYISCWWYNSEQSGNILSVQSWFSGFRLA